MCTCDCVTSAVLPVITAPVSVPLAKVTRTSTTRGVLVSPALIPIYPTTTCRTRCDHACHARVDTSRLPLCFTPSHLTRQPGQQNVNGNTTSIPQAQRTVILLVRGRGWRLRNKPARDGIAANTLALKRSRRQTNRRNHTEACIY